MTPREKVINIEQQVRAMIAGGIAAILRCPFCGGESRIGSGKGLCCEAAAMIVNAVVDRIEFDDGMAIVDRVMNRLESLQNESKVCLN